MEQLIITLLALVLAGVGLGVSPFIGFISVYVLSTNGYPNLGAFVLVMSVVGLVLKLVVE